MTACHLPVRTMENVWRGQMACRGMSVGVHLSGEADIVNMRPGAVELNRVKMMLDVSLT